MEAKGEVQGNVNHFYYCRKHFLLCLPEYTFLPCQTQELQVTCMRAQPLSCVQLFLRPHGLYLVHQAPLSMEFSRHEYWSGLPFSPGDLPDLGIEPASLVSPALAGGFFTTGPPGKPKRLAKKSCMPFLNEAFKSNLLFPIYLKTCNKGYFLT